MAATNTADNIIERIYVKGTLEVVSPLIVGSGEDERADIQLIRDWNGTPFIPGTAIAGAARHYLDEILKDQQAFIDLLFGEKVIDQKKDKTTTQSLISFYDITPLGNINENIALRDGVALEYETKTAKQGAKYDYEIIERGQQFGFRLEVAFRQCHKNREKMKEIVFALLTALKHEKIALGAKTRRGFGTVRLQDGRMLNLDMNHADDVAKWLTFTWNDSAFAHAPVVPEQAIDQPETTEIAVTFDIPYSILIRHYSSNPEDPDTSHLTSNRQSIIPGTSWNGALRHAIYHILVDLKQSRQKIDETINHLFGYVDETIKDAKASRVIIRESLIERGEQLAYTRNKVDRFTGGVVDSALFDEKPHYGGKVELHLTIKDAQDWEKGLIVLALKEVGNGIQTVGGDANIGRGILENPTITIDDEESCLRALARYLQE